MDVSLDMEILVYDAKVLMALTVAYNMILIESCDTKVPKDLRKQHMRDTIKKIQIIDPNYKLSSLLAKAVEQRLMRCA